MSEQKDIQHSRPRWHYSPRSTWMNDPNGLIHYAGTWHLFYQSNPSGSTWGNMSWGHATSTDLLHWTEHPVALWHTDTEQIFSGSCVFDATNSSDLGTADWPPLVALYTAHYLPGSERLGTQAQCLAYSLDGGSHWTTYPGNPVLDRGSANFRDPKVFRHGDQWVMVAVEAEHQHVLIHTSTNLIDWTYRSTFGPAHAAGGAWECPDLFELAVAGSDETRWVLLVNLNPGGVAGGSGCQYFVGDFDGTTFTPDRVVGTSLDRRPGPDDPTLRSYDWLDFGRDCYAVVSFADAPDGRRIVLGWMNNWDYAYDVPLTGGRSIMTIPRELELVPLKGGYRLRQRPIRELPGDALAHYELRAGDRVSIGGVALEYRNGVLSLDRRGAGVEDFHEAFGSRQWAEIPGNPDTVQVDVLVDTCSIEVFAAEGMVTISDLVFFR
ncbi:GH32 C-terminal domain-containing protein [Micropruina sp.]|uniref:GH32 C-terminal domain-containing protein n=1 Tax=Micropruina sp. TaxID=2737536 RepID=UPI0039E47C5B